MKIPTALLAALAGLWPAHGQTPILTSQYDNARTGAILTETTLTPANVNSGRFGRLFSLRVDGDVYGQPLYLPHVEIPGKGAHNVIFVATEHDSVYAFDAEGRPAEPLWHVNFLSSDVTTVPARDVACPFIAPEIGITPTPAIDLASGTIYVLARTKEKGSRYVHRLHALAITTGAEKFGGPVEIKASVKGSGADANHGEVVFDGRRELPRTGLLLSGGQVYLTWGSSCDVSPYHGWVMAYDSRTLAQTAVWNSSPDSEESGIWQSDGGPAADAEGNVYVITGNGKFDVTANGRDYGDSAIKLGLGNHDLLVRDYFTPYNERELNAKDADLGSSGPMLLPDQPGEHPHLLLVAGKDGRLYVIDRDHMGKYRAEVNSHAVQVIKLMGDAYSTASYWNGHVYILAGHDFLKDYKLVGGKLSETPVAAGEKQFANPGATPAISANGNRTGIVWLIETKTWNGADRPAILHAYDASNVAHELYNTEQNADRDRMGKTLRFTVPTVANGRVYVNAKGEIEVYGLLPLR